MNENWSRWIFASLAKHFEDAKGDIANYHVNGMVRSFADDAERLEFRMTGVEFDETTKGFYTARTTVGLLIIVPMTAPGYRSQNLIGRYAAAFEGPIIVKKYGNGIDDDPTVALGCMQLEGRIKSFNWGQIGTDVKVTQSTVECDLSIDLQE